MFRQPPTCSRATAQSDGRQYLSLVDPEWELIDPTPDPRALFQEFDKRFFWSKLACVEVRWSRQMTRCAGMCHYEGRGGLCSIRLSEPLLKLRPRKDLVQTLLHEMIHAYLFITCKNRDRDGHGPQFCEHMMRINAESGANITIYHSFNNEVKFYQRHWWRCQGPCRDRPPFYGYVKRAMNRAPGPSDFWWAEHQRSCGGHYIKVKEPSPSKAKPKVTGSSQKPAGADIRNFVAGSSVVDNSRGVFTAMPESLSSPARTLKGDRGCSLGGSSSVPPSGNAPTFRFIPGVGRLPVHAEVNGSSCRDCRTVLSSSATSSGCTSTEGETGARRGGATPTPDKPGGKVSATAAGKRKLPASDVDGTARKRVGDTTTPGGQPGVQSQNKPSLPHPRPRTQVSGSPGRPTAAPPVHWGPIDSLFCRTTNGSSSQERPVSAIGSRASAADAKGTSGDRLVECPPDTANTARTGDSLVKTSAGTANTYETRRGASGSFETLEGVAFVEPTANKAVAATSHRKASEIPQCKCPVCGEDVELDVMNLHLDVCIADPPVVSATAAADTKPVQWGALCPVCGERIEHALMNDHLDLCLSEKGSQFPIKSSSRTVATVNTASAASDVKASGRVGLREPSVVVDLTADELTAAELDELWSNEPEDFT